MLPSDRSAHPRVRISSAAELYGDDVVRAWAARELIGAPGRASDPDLTWLGGRPDWMPYWRRVWGARALLHLGPGDHTLELLAALDDEHWRVREMSLKVIRAHHVDADVDRVAARLDDPVERVRSAAVRALVAVGDERHMARLSPAAQERLGHRLLNE